MRSRVMYIEDKSGGLEGPSRIGRVTFSKTGATLTYAGRSFQSLKGVGFKANYVDIDTGDHFWISGPRRDGADGLYGRITQSSDVDADVANEYWRGIRGLEQPAQDSSVAAQLIPADARKRVAPTPHGRKHLRVAKIVSRRSASED